MRGEFIINTSLPKKQGLYDPWFEHDACGVGLVANIKGKKSNKILRQALVVLHNMDHRGGQGADMNFGDGAGVLLQISHNFFVKECAKQCSAKSRSFYITTLKQLFAQVTNPLIDAISEEVFTDTTSGIGPELNLIDPQPESCHPEGI